MSIGRSPFSEQFSGSYPFANLGRKPQDLSPSGQNNLLGSAFGSSLSGSTDKMGFFDKRDDGSSDSFYGKNFPHSRSGADLSSQMGGLNLYSNSQNSLPSSSAVGSQSQGFFGSGNMLPGPGFGKSKEQSDRSSPSWGWNHSDPSADLWNRPSIESNQQKGAFPQAFGGGLPSLSTSSRGLPNASLSQFSRSLSQPAFNSRVNELPGFPGSGILPGQSSPQSGLLSLGQQQGQQSVFPSQQGVIGQGSSSISRNLNSPSSSPGLSVGSKLPIASSRPSGLPSSTSLASSGQSAAPGFIGSHINRSLSVASGLGLGMGLLGSAAPSLNSDVGSMHGVIGHIGPGSGSVGSFDQDFPALANRVGGPQTSRQGPSSSFSFVMASGNKLDGNQEFQIHNEDFPALPGSLPQDGQLQQPPSSAGQLFQHQDSKDSTGSDQYRSAPSTSYEQILKDGRINAEKKPRTPLSGIQTYPSGVVTNIPAGMVTDQFGMIGLLTFIRAAETEQNLVTLAVGSDLTTLGLNLNSTESLYHTFGSPFSDSPCKPHEIDFYTPQEYLISPLIREKLAPIKLGRYGEDLLFYLYYTNCGDILQLAAAAELYARDWRYHKDERVWITRFPGMDPQVKTNTYERGTYYYFDSQGWRKVAKEFHVEYDRLEAKPTAQALQQQQAQQQTQQQPLSVA